MDSLLLGDGGNGSVFVISKVMKDGVEVDRVIICRLVPDSSVDGGWKVGEV